jgi:hypothetical protein
MRFVVFIFSLFTIISCSEVGGAPQLPSEEPETDCDAFIQILGQDEFNAITDVEFSIEVVSINQDCLSITISDSGCSPDNWEVNLLTTEAVLESDPLQKILKVEVVNNEACLAVFSKTKTFDLTPVHVEGESEMILNIEGWNTQMSYTY